MASSGGMWHNSKSGTRFVKKGAGRKKAGKRPDGLRELVRATEIGQMKKALRAASDRNTNRIIREKKMDALNRSARSALAPPRVRVR
jgi:hypothetical protein